MVTPTISSAPIRFSPFIADFHWGSARYFSPTLTNGDREASVACAGSDINDITEVPGSINMGAIGVVVRVRFRHQSPQQSTALTCYAKEERSNTFHGGSDAAIVPGWGPINVLAVVLSMIVGAFSGWPVALLVMASVSSAGLAWVSWATQHVAKESAKLASVLYRTRSGMQARVAPRRPEQYIVHDHSAASSRTTENVLP